MVIEQVNPEPCRVMETPLTSTIAEDAGKSDVRNQSMSGEYRETGPNFSERYLNISRQSNEK